MTRQPHAWALAMLLAVLPVAPGWAHGAFHERVAAATAEIQAHPDDPAPLVARAVLYVHHGQWAEADADFRAAEQLNPDDDGLHLAWGQALGRQGRDDEAVARLSGYLGRHPDDPMAHLARGKSLLRLGRTAAAADDFDAAVTNAASPGPDVYIERSRACVLAGDAPRALAGLDEGLRRLGPVVNLVLAAIDIERQMGAYDAALARLDCQIAAATRPETWLSRKGDVLAEAGRTAAAQAAYRAALDALARLPARQREVPEMNALEQRLRGLIAP